MSHVQDTIELLQETLERGESSLDVLTKVYGLLRDNDLPLYNEFAIAYEAYANDEAEVEQELINRVVAALKKCPEPLPPKPLL
jgi:hypothetical protein